MNRPISSKDIELKSKFLPPNKSPGPEGSASHFYHTFMENQYQSSNSSRKIEEQGALPNSF